MSRNMKIVLGVVVVLLLGGCLVVAGMGFMGARFFGQAMDPAKAKAVGAQIADYSLPPGYEELMGFDLVGAKTVMIGQEGGVTGGAGQAVPRGLVIMLAQMPPGAGNVEQMQSQMLQSMNQQGGMGGTDLQPVDTVDATIRGQTVTLQVSEGSARDGTPVRMLSGPFEGKGGPAMLMLFGGTADWDDAAVTAFLASLR